MSTNPTLSREVRLRIYLLQIAEGNEHAMAGFFNETSRLARSFCRRLMRCPAEVDDILSHVYIQVWQKAHTYDTGKGSPISWLSTIVRSRALDRLRQKQLRKDREEPSHRTGPPIEMFRCPRPNPEEEHAQSQRLNRVRQAFELMDAQDRRLLELAYWSGLSQTDIAEETGWPLGTVKSRMRRALLRLRGLMYNEASRYADATNVPDPRASAADDAGHIRAANGSRRRLRS